jgi:hypothetical protein
VQAARNRVLMVVTAVLLALLLPGVQLAALAAKTGAAIARCCCGEHSLDEPCGCPECPSTELAMSKERAARGEAPPDESRVGPCHGAGSEVALVDEVHIVVPRLEDPPPAQRALHVPPRLTSRVGDPPPVSPG